jgi:hypothetical protein
MKIDFNAPVMGLDGKPRKDGATVVLLKDIAVLALDRADADDSKPDAKEKVRRGHLAQRVYGAKEPIALDVEDVALIKRLVGRVYQSTVIVATVEDMLDPQGEPPEPKREPTPEIPSGK